MSCHRHESFLRLLVLACALVLLGASAPAGSDDAVLTMPVTDVAQTLAASPTFVHVHARPGEAALMTDAADGRFDEHSLLAAALIACGTDDTAARARGLREFDALAARLQASLRGTQNQRQRAKAVLTFLHRNILRGEYHAECSDLRTTLEHGDYNCLSSAILYVCLAERCGLRAVGAQSPAHVVVRVWIDGQPVDVETTCLDWRQAIAAQPAQQAKRELTPAGLVALVYYNRGLDLLEQRSFAEAAAANLRAMQLDPSSRMAEGNLLATLNNWALDAHGRGQRDAALAILRRGLQIAPGYATFRDNAVAISQR